MKHIKLFENSNGEQIVLNTMNEYTRICDLIRDFINIEKLYNIEVHNVIRYYFEKDMEVIGDSVIICIFGFNDRDYDEDVSIFINEEQQKKLYKFIEDPDLYRSAKKYNI